MGEILRFDPIARRLGTARAREQVDDLLAGDDARERVHALEPPTLYSLIMTMGVQDTLELVHLASAEQVQGLVDLSSWYRDRLDMERLKAWLAILVQGPEEHWEAIKAGIDPELLGMFLKTHVEIYAYEDEDDAEALERIQGRVESTPDGVHALVMPEDEAAAELIRLTLRWLYAVDQEAARQLVTAAQRELVSQLEETAYQMRTARMEQWGFLPLEEAREIYARVDPPAERARARKVVEGGGTGPTVAVHDEVHLPVPVAEQLLRLTGVEGSFLGRALRRAVDEAGEMLAADRLLKQLSALVNRVLVADHGDPGSLEDLETAFVRAHGYLNVGLEYLAEEDLAAAAKLVADWPLKRILRAGFNLVASLSAQARRLTERGNLTLTDELTTSLCTADESELIESLLGAQPTRSITGARDFASLAEVVTAANSLSLLAYKELWTFGYQRLTKATLVGMLTWPPGAVAGLEEVGFDGLLATRAALRLVGGNGPWRLLLVEEVASLCADHISRDGLSSDLASSLATVAQPPQSEDSLATRKLADRWVSAVSEQLIGEYGTLEPTAFERPELLPRLLLLVRPG